tara:strand:+ start:165 stop:413 length:249 start_codon:yes stop_codon:yes gene_type:complete
MRPLIALCLPCGSDIAIALHTPPHRAVSLALVAQALGATQGKGRFSRTVSSMGSFSLPKGRISSRKVLKTVDVEDSSTQDDV